MEELLADLERQERQLLGDKVMEEITGGEKDDTTESEGSGSG